MRLPIFVFAALACSGLAMASITPALNGGSPTEVSPGVYTWSYNIAVNANESLDPSATTNETCLGGTPCPFGTFFTLYDIAGLITTTVDGPTEPTGWGSAIQLTGITPSGQLLFDDPGVENITFYYTGATTNGPTVISAFTYDSIYGTPTEGTFSYQDTKIQTLTLDQGQGPILIPSTTTSLSGVPEPASVLMIGGGLIALALVGRRRARQ
ncbi:MAG: VPLPA-CTERM sorting domain-containing protein [Bryobacteraceae bacterium]|jgi:hypothetical protein